MDPVSAEPIHLATKTRTSQPGGITGQVSVTKVGALIAEDAIAILSGSEIKIESKKEHKSNIHTPTENLLSGVLFQTKTLEGATSGYAVFNGGNRFSRINTTACPETVLTVTGITYEGHIISVTPQGLSINTNNGVHNIAANDIQEIRSPVAFKYNLPESINAK